MKLKNHDLALFLLFSDMETQIVLETVFNLKVEVILFPFNYQPMDVLFFPTTRQSL
jgi:hypothetical protein